MIVLDAPGHILSDSPRECARCRALTRERRPARLALVERIRAMPRVEDAPQAPGVYVLLDPRDATARYVGSSLRPVERIGEHRRERRTGTGKHAWLAALDARGMRPDAYLVHRATGEGGAAEAREYEYRWLLALLQVGAPLTNKETGAYWSMAHQAMASGVDFLDAREPLPRHWGIPGHITHCGSCGARVHLWQWEHSIICHQCGETVTRSPRVIEPIETPPPGAH